MYDIALMSYDVLSYDFKVLGRVVVWVYSKHSIHASESTLKLRFRLLPSIGKNGRQQPLTHTLGQREELRLRISQYGKKNVLRGVAPNVNSCGSVVRLHTDGACAVIGTRLMSRRQTYSALAVRNGNRFLSGGPARQPPRFMIPSERSGRAVEASVPSERT
ncbi:hypothetical protein EVAR_25672_1 [Eumeta japonica]|uniref:Uncharacterized protein n=1 Tax=Eumeta variegata TaxID=151549 RepID=A0A4C1WDM2_EUMVA|nr:hypothetical protein EVAR_25672_1 [Eumeta japonica]